MVFYLVGLGLGDEKDITVKGLEAVRSCSLVFLEHYTSVLCVGKEKLEEYYGCTITLADRDMVESEVEEKILEPARTQNVALLVVGDPFGATTHSDLFLRCLQMGIKVEVIHNASIMNAIAATGLQLYNFGLTVSICFFTDTWRPDSFYEKIKVNRDAGLHTLCLLDIKMKEQSIENLLRGKKIYEPPRFLTVNQCIEQLLEVEEKKKQNVYSDTSFCVGVARVGQKDQQIVAGTMAELLEHDFGPPLHAFVIPGEIHPVEKEFLEHYSISKSEFVSPEH